MNSNKIQILHLLQELQLEIDDDIRIRQYIESNNYAPVIALLRGKRGGFLQRLHICQKAIDDLDLLVYLLKRLELGGQ